MERSDSKKNVDFPVCPRNNKALKDSHIPKNEKAVNEQVQTEGSANRFFWYSSYYHDWMAAWGSNRLSEIP